MHPTLDLPAQATQPGPTSVTTASDIPKLIAALEGCLHPRAQRLRACLEREPQGAELERVRIEVLGLLTLSFGRREALRRLE